MRLEQLVLESAKHTPNALAVAGSDGTMTYAQLDDTAARVATQLSRMGVVEGDRIALWADKSCRAVSIMQAAMRLGAAYVPLDPGHPVERARSLLEDAGCRMVATTQERARTLRTRGVELPVLVLDDAPEDATEPTWDEACCCPVTCWDSPRGTEHSLAYILYTSGSTGAPKGVCITHRNAMAFVQWAADELGVAPEDRLANHAPFHFDLSVFDLYVSFLVGASVHLVPEGASFAPSLLVQFLRERRITVWYSVPSVLMLMMERGGLLDADGDGPPAPRIVAFAGEVFPIKPLRRLREGLPDTVMYNFYGPTETNVCTAYRLPPRFGAHQMEVPIGRAASFDRVYAVRADGELAREGETGELWVDGPSVMHGYRGGPRHEGPYATGDQVLHEGEGAYRFLGRLDRQVKVRGHRIELGEIESTLRDVPNVADCAVAVEGSGMDAQLVAFVVPTDASAPPSLLELKRHSARILPRYMILDHRHVVEALPRTRNGKLDRDGLQSWVAPGQDASPGGARAVGEER